MTRRLLVLTSTYPRWANDPEPGFVHELCKRLTGDFEVLVLSPHAPGAERQELMDGVTIHRYRYAPEKWQTLVSGGGIISNLKQRRWKWLLVPFFLLAQLLATYRLIKQFRPHVIHAHWLIPQGVLLVMLKAVGVTVPRFVVTSHGADLFALKSSPLMWLKRRVIRQATGVTVVSSAMKDEVSRSFSGADKTQVAPMGVDMQYRFTPDPTIDRSNSEILFVGRLVEKKGLVHLIAVMPKLLAANPAIRLTIAGGGPEEAALRTQVETLSLQDKVSFLGPVAQPALPALYRRAGLFVAPFVEAMSGDQEGLGLVTIEAVACLCPALIGAVPAVRDIPVATVDVANHELFAAEILRILSSANGAASIALQQREICVAQFDWLNVAKRYTAILNEAAGFTG